MAEGFEDLGIREELVDATEEADYPQPTELQAAAIPVLRRGNNAVLHASAGAGVVGAYGLALLDRLAGEGGAAGEDGAEAQDPGAESLQSGDAGPAVGALVLTPTVEGAARTAESLAPFASAAGLRVLALAPGWAGADGVADIVIATPRAALRAVAASELKLGGLRVLVLDGADVLLSEAADAVESLTGTVPTDAQRVIVAGELDDVGDYVDRHVRRALTIPKTESTREAEEGSGLVAYMVRADGYKLDALGRLLASHAGPAPLVFCRTDERAALVADALAGRGFAVGPAGDTDADVAVAAASAETVDASGHLPLSYDVPADAPSFLARHAAGGVVMAEPRELAHLRRIAARAGVRLQPRKEDVSEAVEEDADAYRERLRRAVGEEDLTAQILLLEPLFRELSTAEVAAAASALLRRKAAEAPSPGPRQQAGATEAAASPSGPPVRTAAPAPPAQPAWTRLFISVGSRDGARAGDLVGAITGEAGISGDRVGKVEIRENFSLVEVAGPDAERVISALNGTTVKGRSVRVDFHRERGGPGAGPPRGRESGGAARRGPSGSGGGAPPRGGRGPGGGGGFRRGGGASGGGSRGGGRPHGGGEPGRS